MQKKDVPGFCVDLKEAIAALGISDDAELLMKDGKEIRKELKKVIIEMQKQRLIRTHFFFVRQKWPFLRL